MCVCVFSCNVYNCVFVSVYNLKRLITAKQVNVGCEISSVAATGKAQDSLEYKNDKLTSAI